MPVTIWSMKMTRVALPNTYHQLAELRGTGWAMVGPRSFLSCRRSSNQSATAHHTGSESVGIWPPRTSSFPSLIRCSYW